MSDLQRLVEPMIPALRRYARALLRDTVAADDLVQDCLERVVAHWQQRRGKDPRTWAFAILHNLAVNRMRQKARRGDHLPFEDVEEGVLARRPPQEDALVQAELVSALAQLPDDQRSLLLLVSVEDLSYAQVSEILAIPIGTVMSRLSRARERLRQLLENSDRSATRRGGHLRSVK
ncbi:RNA polymerase sigma factor [Labrys portucalensis]|uniref:RNA polymerase sigma factor n=1 Tax=Labrys neptuniae TaxID=376174 RepID=A0ABV6ZP45_9HYPH